MVCHAFEITRFEVKIVLLHTFQSMEAIRKIVTLEDRILRIELPESYRDKTVELIILPAEEKEQSLVNEEKVDYKSLQGAWKSKLTDKELDERLKALRDEWSRDTY